MNRGVVKGVANGVAKGERKGRHGELLPSPSSRSREYCSEKDDSVLLPPSARAAPGEGLPTSGLAPQQQSTAASGSAHMQASRAKSNRMVAGSPKSPLWSPSSVSSASRCADDFSVTHIAADQQVDLDGHTSLKRAQGKAHVNLA